MQPETYHATYKQESQCIDPTSLALHASRHAACQSRAAGPVRSPHMRVMFTVIFLCLIVTCPAVFFPFFLPENFLPLHFWGGERVRMTVGECNCSWQTNICHKGITALWSDSPWEESSLHSMELFASDFVVSIQRRRLWRAQMQHSLISNTAVSMKHTLRLLYIQTALLNFQSFSRHNEFSKGMRPALVQRADPFLVHINLR